MEMDKAWELSWRCEVDVPFVVSRRGIDWGRRMHSVVNTAATWGLMGGVQCGVHGCLAPIGLI